MNEVAPGIDRESEADARRVMEELYPDAEVRRAVLGFLAESIHKAHGAGIESWELSLFEHAFTLNVGQVYMTTGGQDGQITFVLDSASLDEHDKEILRSYGFLRPSNLKMIKRPADAFSIEGSRLAELRTQDDLADRLREAHGLAIESAVRARRIANFQEAHSPGLLKYMRSFLGMAIPDPGWAQPDPLAQVRTAFQRFRAEPIQHFRVRVRRHQAERVKDVLSHPETIDLDTFNREVWQFESKVTVGDENISNVIFGSDDVLTARLPEMEAALDSGRLDFHGNATWGSGAHVFGARMRDEVEKLANVRNAARILNDHALDPLEKANALIKLKGFGPNIATGLVMMFHPSDFAIYNGPSRAALHALGYPENTVEQFEESVRSLREHLGAQDFLELDWFLYCHRGEPPEPGQRFWWVNQGESYAQERDNKYLAAGVTSKGGKPISHHETMKQLAAGDIVFHYSGGMVRAVGEVQEPAMDGQQAHESATGDEGAGYLVPLAYYELSNPIRLTDIPQPWRTKEGGPFNQQGSVDEGYLFPLSQGFVDKLKQRFPGRWPEGSPLNRADKPPEPTPPPPPPDVYVEPSFDDIVARITAQGMEIDEQTLRRYHLSLKVRGFVILAGVSGTGKTWLTQAYAGAVGACYLRVPVAPNWNSNEDLLGYFNPIDGKYHDTPFSDFLRQAAKEYRSAREQNRTPVPYHLCLDEMNLARVEYYFAAFLSAMEEIGRMEREIDLHQASDLKLPPNLLVVGTVNVDETTHGFADKVYDRAQLIELPLSREAVERFVGDVPYREVLMEIWDAVEPIAPFAFRVVRDIKAYVSLAGQDGDAWHVPFDEQILQKVLPKLVRTDARVGQILTQLISITSRNGLDLSCHKAETMLEGFRQYGFASYF